MVTYNVMNKSCYTDTRLNSRQYLKYGVLKIVFCEHKFNTFDIRSSKISLSLMYVTSFVNHVVFKLQCIKDAHKHGIDMKKNEKVKIIKEHQYP